MNLIKNVLTFCVLTFFLACSSDGKKKMDAMNIKNNRFIAHAGGGINDKVYTNSLEALNANYAKGCRLFELDILETSDGKLVAVHDWEEFKAFTSYEGKSIGKAALTEKEVLSSKIFENLTPLNMDRINDWFRAHPDAVLVTDKINDPNRFFDSKSGFLFKDRCVMELFSKEAIEAAKELEVAPMVSSNVIFQFEKERNRILRYIKKRRMVSYLKSHDIRYICFSYRKIKTHRKFLSELKSMGIVAYVFHVNQDNGVDEEYILKNYSKYIYGLYADDLNILKSTLGQTNHR